MTFNKIKKATELSNGNYVAIGVTIGNFAGAVQCGHSAIFISKGDEKLIFHWIGGSIKLDDYTDSNYDASRNNYFGCYLKYLNNLNDSDIDSIIATLTDVKEHSNFAYGYVFNGGLYDDEGNYFSDNGLQEVGTCVTLCTNIFKTLLVTIDDYMHYSDWDLIEPSDPNYHMFLQGAQTIHPNLDMDLYNANHKRVTPEEMTISSLFGITDMPIRKTNIDDYKVVFNSFIRGLGF